MSYSVSEASDDAKRRAKAIAAIAKQYPDAYLSRLPDGTSEWSHPTVKPDRLRAVAEKNGDGRVWLCPYVLVEGMALYSTTWEHATIALGRLNGGAYQSLIWAVLYDQGVPPNSEGVEK